MRYIELVVQAFQYDFMRRALVVGVLIALSCAFLGTFLVLRRLSMIGDGLAHVSFAAVALALLLSASPLVVSIPLVVLASFAIMSLGESGGVNGDAAIGLVASFSVAAGVIIATMARGFNVDLMSYLFGSILLITRAEVWIAVFLSALVLAVVIFFYNSLFAVTYDEEFARVMGLSTTKLNYLIGILTSVTIAIGMRVVGTMLISSLIVFPAVTALQIARGFKSSVIIAAAVSVLCVVLGIFASYVFNLPTGATVVMFNAAVFLVAFTVRRMNLT